MLLKVDDSMVVFWHTFDMLLTNSPTRTIARTRTEILSNSVRILHTIST